MLDIRFILENVDLVRQNTRERYANADVDKTVALYGRMKQKGKFWKKHNIVPIKSLSNSRMSIRQLKSVSRMRSQILKKLRRH